MLINMTRKAVRTVVLSNSADFCNGMATAWTFASYDALIDLAWMDLISSLCLARLSFSLSIGVKLKLNDKHT
jgi:hypothetical protein